MKRTDFQRPMPLSRAARDARRPPPPEALVDMLQDSVHRQPTRARVAMAVKCHKAAGTVQAMKCPYERCVIDPCERKLSTGRANECQACIDAHREQMGEKRNECQVCGEEIARGKPMCYACERGYEAAERDVVAFLKAGGDVDAIERGEHVGAAGKAKP